MSTNEVGQQSSALCKGIASTTPDSLFVLMATITGRAGGDQISLIQLISDAETTLVFNIGVANREVIHIKLMLQLCFAMMTSTSRFLINGVDYFF